MAQLTDIGILRRLIEGEVATVVGVTALFDRDTMRFVPEEGKLLDYKQRLSVEDSRSVAEMGRDVLAFSNTEGGILLLGVDKEKTLIGHAAIDYRRLRGVFGAYIGTRVDYDVEEIPLSVSGKPYRVIAIVVRRSQTVYPNQLRKDIELRPNLGRKLKYLKGTLFYRVEDVTQAESPYGDIEAKARELGFSGAAPRTRTSFLLQEDRPGLRLYAHINDRFFGRNSEISEILSRFQDPRGRGVSIAGFGGMGKTELAIKLATELYRRGMFQSIYSGSAKQTLLGPGGPQQTDPAFTDLGTFLDDLCGWLGMNPPRLGIEQLEQVCVTELAKLKRVLLLVDNLETVTDRQLLDFLDKKLPQNCWIIATSRIHKIRNVVYPIELHQMEAGDAAHLLRYELRRQGLQQLADAPIEELNRKAVDMLCHPLAIRWFAWACKKDPDVWRKGLGTQDLKEVERFCVGHTLGALDNDALKVLGAVFSASGVSVPTEDCVRTTCGLEDVVVERSLWDLECAGMVQATIDEDGMTAYSVAAMAQNAVAELNRKRGWEPEYVSNLRTYTRQLQDSPLESPLLRDLVRMETHAVKFYSRDERQELIVRIDRALPRCPERYVTKLKWLKAECHRHLDSPISADDLYRECADRVLAEGPVKNHETDKIRILMEAATVAKARAQTDSQITRGIRYLQSLENTDFAHIRVLGMLTEFFALVGDRANYERYLRYVMSYKDSSEYIPGSQLDALEEALDRAKIAIARRKS